MAVADPAAAAAVVDAAAIAVETVAARARRPTGGPRWRLRPRLPANAANAADLAAVDVTVADVTVVDVAARAAIVDATAGPAPTASAQAAAHLHPRRAVRDRVAMGLRPDATARDAAPEAATGPTRRPASPDRSV